jgi:hypothetical protein
MGSTCDLLFFGQGIRSLADGVLLLPAASCKSPITAITRDDGDHSISSLIGVTKMRIVDSNFARYPVP